MNVKRKFCLALVLAILAFVLFAITRHPVSHEPNYAGRTFTSWFHEDELAPNFFNNAPSTKAICAMGEAAVPCLLACVQQDDAWWQAFYLRGYSRLPQNWQRRLPTPRRPGIRQMIATRLLFELGLPSRAAAPALIRAYDHASKEYYHLSTWGAIDWTRQLTNPPNAVFPGPSFPGGDFRFWALQVLARYGTDDPKVIPLLLSALHDPDANMHGLVLAYMRNNTNLTFAIEHSEPVLLTALADPNPVVRAPAAEMLGVLVTNHPEVIPPLLKAANDLDATVRVAALESLAKSPVTLAQVLPVLAPALSDPNAELRRRALALVFHAGGGAKIFPTLEAALDNPDPVIRAAAAQTLGFFGPRAKASAPRLIQLTDPAREPDDRVRHAATDSLQKIAPGEIPVSPPT